MNVEARNWAENLRIATGVSRDDDSNVSACLQDYRDRTRRTTRLFVHAALFLATDGNDQMNSTSVEANTSLSFGPGSQEGMCKRCWTCIQGYNLLHGLDLPDGPSSVDCRRSSLYAEPKMRLRYGPVCAAWHGARVA